jgi:cob(I)alamin adenosyltransferase
MPATPQETMDERLDRLEAMLLGLTDQLERLGEQLQQPLRVQERALRRLEDAVDDLREQMPRRSTRLPPPVRLEPPVEEPS